jgi:hypothetical protein
MTERLTLPTARNEAEAMMRGAADTVSGDVYRCLTVGTAPGLTERGVERLDERFDDALAGGQMTRS